MSLSLLADGCSSTTLVLRSIISRDLIMLSKFNLSNYGITVIYIFLATIVIFSGAFSPPSGKSGVSFSNFLGTKLQYKTSAVKKFRKSFCLNVKKRKDNRKYVASPKDDLDEPDDDYFQELAEDVKALLRSSRTEPTVTLAAERLPVVDDIIVEDEDDSETAFLTSEDENEEDHFLHEPSAFSAMQDDVANQNYVISPDDIADDDEDDVSIATPAPTDVWIDKVGKIIHQVVLDQGLFVQKIHWGKVRVEVIISASPDVSSPTGPSVSALQQCHRSIYDEFERREEELAVVTKFEIVVASPGIGEVLRSDQDYISFKGFTVSATTTELFRKKNNFVGTLVERTGDDVCISMKGRIAKIPRSIIAEVRLPKPKYETTDTEMRKLR